MKRFSAIAALFLAFACASPTLTDIRPEDGARYVTASWYGQKFHGRPTSSGERYDMYRLTAAHKTLKFGTRLRVTNPDTGQSADVTVNDRGPFIRGRDLDLSYGAAKRIGLIKKGVGKVKVEYLGRDRKYVKRVPYVPVDATQALTIQVGSFKDKGRAFHLKEGLAFQYRDVYVTTVVVKGERYYRVKVGKYDTYKHAFSVAEKLADEGYDTLITRRN
jgi:rare lipoprotein A